MLNFESIDKNILFKTVFDQSANLILITDTRGYIKYANQRFCEVSKYSLEELLNKHSNINKSGFQPKEFYENLWSTVRAGKTFRGEFKNKDKFGEYYWIYSTISPIFDKNNQIIYYVAISENITYKKLLEKTSIYSETFVKNLFANLQKSGIIVIDSSKTVKVAEGEVLSLLTVTHKISLEQHVEVFFNEVGLSSLNQEIEHVFQSNKAKTLEVDLQQVSLRIILLPILNAQDAAENVLILFQDITEYRQLLNKLSIAKKQFQAIFENAGAGIATLNSQGLIEICNSSFKELFEIDEFQPNIHIFELFAKKDTLTLLSTINTLVNSDDIETFRNTFAIESKKGKTKWIDITLSLWIDILEQKRQLILLAFNVTDVIEARKDSEEREKILQELNKTKDRFFSIISHDLRNPFNSILGFSEYILQNYDILPTNDVKRFMDIIYNASLNAFELLENLLEWSRTQQGKISYQPKQYLVKPMVDHVIEQLSAIAQRKEINLTVDIDQNLQVFCDINMTNTVLRNLISNAIKFSYRNSSVEISANQNGSMVNISVTDHGIGMTQEIIDKLFSMEELKSQKGTEHEPGTGLGLVLCKEFVAANKGQLYVKSHPNNFTTFTISLPIQE